RAPTCPGMRMWTSGLMTPSDLLLFWLSGHREVPLQRVYRACRALEEPPGFLSHPRRLAWWRRRRWRLWEGLLRLGHVEAVTLGRWQVVPPTLVWLGPDDEGEGYLCGARSPRLLRCLARENRLVLLEPEPQDGAPARWAVRG